MYYTKHDSTVRNFGYVDGGIIHVDVRKTFSGREKPRVRRRSPRGLNPVVKNVWDVYLIHVDLRKHVPVVKNLGHNNVVHVDYEKHDPIVRKLKDDEVKHVNEEKYGPAMRILAIVEVIILLTLDL